MSQEISDQPKRSDLIKQYCNEVVNHYRYALINALAEFYETWRSYWSFIDLNKTAEGPVFLSRIVGDIAFFAGIVDEIIKLDAHSKDLFNKLVAHAVSCLRIVNEGLDSGVYDKEVEKQVEGIVIQIMNGIDAQEIIELKIAEGRQAIQNLVNYAILMISITPTAQASQQQLFQVALVDL